MVETKTFRSETVKCSKLRLNTKTCQYKDSRKYNIFFIILLINKNKYFFLLLFGGENQKKHALLFSEINISTLARILM